MTGACLLPHGAHKLFGLFGGDINHAAAFFAKVGIEPDVPVHSCTDDNNIGGRLLQEHIAADEAYQAEAAPVVERRIAQAGVRLAMILNDAARPTP